MHLPREGFAWEGQSLVQKDIIGTSVDWKIHVIGSLAVVGGSFLRSFPSLTPYNLENLLFDFPLFFV